MGVQLRRSGGMRIKIRTDNKRATTVAKVNKRPQPPKVKLAKDRASRKFKVRGSRPVGLSLIRSVESST